MIDYFKRHKHNLFFIGLLIICFFVYFCGIGSYPLMDVDETRYASIARDMFNSKDFLTLYVNGSFFFEKPPLFFWSECLSFNLFNKINEFTVRFPAALYAMLLTVAVYFTGKKIISAKYGFICALILTTTLEFSILSRFAILDIILTSLVGFSVLCGFLTQFVQEKNKKYFWWAFYIFSALAVMAKGIPGFIIPFGSMFFITLFNKTFKDCFKPSYIIPGAILFFAIILPWHIIMLKIHSPLFFDEYIVKHHLHRFFSSEEIERAEPFLFYVPTLLWGLMPYTLSILAVGIEKIFNKCKFDFSNMNSERKFLWFNLIAFFFVFLFFSISSTKLITYILPVYIFTSFLIGFIWQEYIDKNKYQVSIQTTSYITGTIFILMAIGGYFTKYFLPEQLYTDIYPAKWFCISVFLITGIFLIFFTFKKMKTQIFMTFVIFIAVLAAFGTKIFYNIDYKFGQQDLIDFAEQENDTKNNLYVINNYRKYSVLYYGEGANIRYMPIQNEATPPKETHEIFSKNSKAIIRNSDFDYFSGKYNIELLEKKRKYSLVKFKSIKPNGKLGG